MSKIFKIYGPDSMKTIPTSDALDELIKGTSFTVFLEFIDPRIDSLVQEDFTFYPKPLMTSQGRCFIAEHIGLSLKIPSDCRWWSGKQNQAFVKIKQKTVILIEGEYKPITFDVTSSTSFRQS